MNWPGIIMAAMVCTGIILIVWIKIESDKLQGGKK